jgi:hypothetical protein
MFALLPPQRAHGEACVFGFKACEPFANWRPGQTMSDEAPTSVKAPTLFRNYVSFAGAVIVAASLASIVLLFLIEITKAADNPYLGILT